MKKLKTRIAALVMMISLLAVAPGAALADQHKSNHGKHGPMPVAIVGTIFGGALWLVSTPFTALLAPKQFLKSFDTMVAEPWRTTIGSDR